MKRKKIIIPVILICILSTIVFLKNTTINSSKYKVNYVPDASENNIKVEKLKYDKLSDESPGKVTTYETVQPIDIQKDVENILKIFGISDKYTKTEYENKISFIDGEKQLNYYKNTGGIQYYDSSLMNSDKSIDINEINNPKYYEKAEDILNKLGVKNTISRSTILPNDIRKKDSNNNPIEFKLLHVSFFRNLDGIKVKGSDKVMFDFDYKGDIASAVITIREYKKVEQVTVKSPKKAFEKFVNTKNGYIGTDDALSTAAEISESELVYWVEGIDKKQLTKPIYATKGKTLPGTKADKNLNNSVYIEIDAID